MRILLAVIAISVAMLIQLIEAVVDLICGNHDSGVFRGPYR